MVYCRFAHARSFSFTLINLGRNRRNLPAISVQLSGFNLRSFRLHGQAVHYRLAVLKEECIEINKRADAIGKTVGHTLRYAAPVRVPA